MLPTLRTETEQKEVWCPRAICKSYNEQPASINRDSNGYPMDECRCLASGCAAWVYGKNLKGLTVGYCGLLGSNHPDNSDLVHAHVQ